MLFDSWHQLGVVAARAVIGYVAVIVALRLIGAQVLAQMSSYDLVVTIALGSLVAAIPFSTELALADCVAAVLALFFAQEAIRWAQARSPRVRTLVREAPCVVVWHGHLAEDRIRSHNVTEDEIRAAIRRAGLSSIGEALAVVLENDGNWSVIAKTKDSDLSAFEGLDVPRDDDDDRDD